MKRGLSLLLGLILLFSSLALFCACAPRKEKYTLESFDYFDTVTVITGYAENENAFRAVADRVLRELGEYHRLYDIYHTYEGLNNLATVNALTDGEHRVVTVDRRIVELLQFSKVLAAQTGGKVNVAMGSLLSIWHRHRTQGSATLPDGEELTAAAEHTDLANVILDETASTVFLADPKLLLDVGAVAKGYAVECIAQALESEGISGYLLNVGGNVRTIGGKPDGTTWISGVETPFSEGASYAARVSLRGQSLVTSGSYQRYYTVDGVNYHHIINPETRMPATYYTSVTVLANSSALADALSTALFCMSYEEGLAVLGAYENVGAMWIFPDGEVKKSDFLRAACVDE